MPDLLAGLSESGMVYQNQPVFFRPFTEQDLPLLKKIYASTREDELIMTGWNDTQKQQFINHQFNAQHQHYQQHYGDAEFLLFETSKAVLGRLYLQQRNSHVCLIDITLLPPFRQQKLGQQILGWILQHAKKIEKTVTLHVEKNNPAYQWYLNNGFINCEDRGVYQYLEWYPQVS